MLWLKIFLACAIVAFGTLMGYLAAGKYRARARFFTQMQDFNEKYYAELGYARKPLPVLVKSYEAKGDFQKILERFSEKRVSEITLSYLTKEEKSQCSDYFSMLGRGDAHSQRDYFGARRSPLGEKSAACTKQAKEKGELYLKLGLLGGLAFVILIV